MALFLPVAAAGQVPAAGVFTDISRGDDGVPFDHVVYTTAIGPNGDLYAGGSFTAAAGVPAPGIGRWDGSSWHALGLPGDSILAKDAWAFEFASNGDVYVNAQFSHLDAPHELGIGRWDGEAWHMLPAGQNNSPVIQVFEPLALGGDGTLYATAVISTAQDTTATTIAQWDGESWIPMGSTDLFGDYTSITALEIGVDGSVFAGGESRNTPGDETNRIVRWDGSEWTVVGGGLSSVSALAKDPSGNLYAAIVTRGAGSPKVVRLDGEAWTAVRHSENSSAERIRSLVFDPSGTLFAGGVFPTGSAPGSCAGVRMWNGVEWSTVMQRTDPWVVHMTVRSLSIDSNGDLIIGGQFDGAGDVSSPYLVKFTAASVASEPAPSDAPVGISVSPNPSSDIATISARGLARGYATVSIVDVLGREVYRSQGDVPAESAELAVDVSAYPSGIYVVRIVAGSDTYSGTMTVTR